MSLWKPQIHTWGHESHRHALLFGLLSAWPIKLAKGKRDACQSRKPGKRLCVTLSAPVRSPRSYSKLRKPRFRGGVFYPKSAQQKTTELDPQAPSFPGLLRFLFSLSRVKDTGCEEGQAIAQGSDRYCTEPAGKRQTGHGRSSQEDPFLPSQILPF